MKTEEPIRMTPQRRALLQVLRETRSHPTADELYEKVRQELPKISLGTVYRNLEILSARGMIRKIELCGAQMRFDAENSDHCHIRCVRCGRLGDMSGQGLPGLQELLDARPGRGAREAWRTGDLLRARASLGPDGHDEDLAGHSNYEIIGHRIEFFGICPQCRDRAETS